MRRTFLRMIPWFSGRFECRCQPNESCTCLSLAEARESTTTFSARGTRALPKINNSIQAIEFRLQEPLRSLIELKLYIFRELRPARELQPLILRLKAQSSCACLQPSKTFACTWLARLCERMPLPRLGRALEDVRLKNAAVCVGTHDCR